MLGLHGRLLCRHIHLSVVCNSKGKVDKALLSKLRKKTGFPFITCKQALLQFDNDLKQAEAWMKEEAQKKGWEKATKLQERPMSQGVVGVLHENQSAAMVEVNCETDFVARNTQFRELVKKAAAVCLRYGTQSGQAKLLIDSDTAKSLEAEDGKTLADLVALEIGSLGENMLLRRAAFMTALTEGAHIGRYVHSADQVQAPSEKYNMGKYGVLVSFTQKSPPQGELSTEVLGQQLAQHIVGMNPSCIEASPVDDSDGEQVKNTETPMLPQEFLLTPELTVKEFLDQNEASVTDFVRFQCGEELAENEEDQEKIEHVASPENNASHIESQTAQRT